MRLLPVLLVAGILLAPAAGWAADPVDVALVLVTDVSRSVDDGEFKLEKDGYAAAFTDPRVLAAIRNGMTGAIAVAYVEFASRSEVRTVVDWTRIHDEGSARGFADAVANAPRTFYGRTAISAGIDHAMQLLGESGIEATRRVIDVAGDGTNNAGRDVAEARDEAVQAGVTVNGLAIINDHPEAWTFAHVQPPEGLVEYYRRNVTGGTGSFVLEIHDFKDFGEAMTRKLVNEIAELADRKRL